MTTHCRIGKIKLRNGAVVEVVPTAKRSACADKLIKEASAYADLLKDLRGFALVAYNEDSYLCSIIADGKTMFASAMPEFTKTALIRQLCEGDAERLIKKWR